METAAPIVMAADGLPVTFGERGIGVTIATNGKGIPVTEVASGGLPVRLVGAPPGGMWILALGSWDDTGVWDDTAVWID